MSRSANHYKMFHCGGGGSECTITVLMEEKLEKYIITATDILWLPGSLYSIMTTWLPIHSCNYLSHYPLPWLLVSLSTPTTTCLTIDSYNYLSHYPLLQLLVSLSTPTTTCLTIHSYNYLTQITATTTCLSSLPSGVNSRQYGNVATSRQNNGRILRLSFAM